MKDIKKAKKDNVGYIGLVEIGIVKNRKKHKIRTVNEGKYVLFEFLCNCLAAKLNPDISASVKNRPMCLNIGTTSKIISRGIPFSDISVNGDNSSFCSITFNFLIPGTSIIGQSINRVQLVDNTGQIVYAEASIGENIIISDIDTNVYVSWELRIKNG